MYHTPTRVDNRHLQTPLISVCRYIYTTTHVHLVSSSLMAAKKSRNAETYFTDYIQPLF